MKESPGVPIHVVALYSYESQNPEDLSFNQGDSILLLTKGSAHKLAAMGKTLFILDKE